MDAPIGIKNGCLAVMRSASSASAPIQESPAEVEVIRGGLRKTILPLGHSLLASAGVSTRDAFVLILDNDRASVACLLAAMELECVCVLVGKSRMALLPHVTQQTGLTKIITVDNANSKCNVEQLESGDESWTHSESIISGGVGLLTSGSVGEPKVVMCSWERMLLQGQATHDQLFPDRPARIICATSIAHAYSINAIFTLLMSPFDAKSELCFAPNTESLYHVIADECDNCVVLYATPATYTRLLQFPARKLHVDIPFSAGSRLSRVLFEQTQAHNGLKIMQNYGSTETGDIAAWGLSSAAFSDESSEDIYEQRAYVGRLWPGVRVQIEQDGEVLVWTPWQSLGYVIDGTLYPTNGAPHRTADRGVIRPSVSDVTTLLWLEGRIRPPINLKLGAGRPLSLLPEVVEKVFLSHDRVTDALALMPDPTQRSIVLRVRLVHEEPSALALDSLCEWAAPKLGISASNILIEVVEFLPCSPAGKLLYR